eukprot:CAMPEP_0204186946 /NCGR_PEP_ID=MMETSP0361-20130328/56401_1 /ASSEMBLY_ACC=CAM_ASM_000343 /TAXON_ID=268821 /ORGANISM="Scrippsiella Hangoei, Strain SHTV-5" /LENGTH=53 /DNA_ID=CAMNT_0051147291 /DNA_START=297 /DNA_END=455 /DNA_ORIENTATION=+
MRKPISTAVMQSMKTAGRLCCCRALTVVEIPCGKSTATFGKARQAPSPPAASA